ncbi:3-oxoacyl-[acyl-carrier-protein] synthase 2 [bacterium BMS3Abin10]|nr:3-oxoacyl-[acyl-carrier-protein] synthase 2 [bacterium BMS3Abin10]GBE38066.1 3-oxoacyl-[acyl-carrier-protein] synthase 2 [bacterium BMS3Bbin08]
MRKRKNKKIVVTGLGVIAPNGIGKEQFWQALKEGRSGIKPISRFDTSEFKCKLAGEIYGFKPTYFLGSKGLRSLDRTARLLCSAAKLAIEDGGFVIDNKNTDDIGVCTGTTLSSLWNFAEFEKGAIVDGPLFTDASLFPGTVVNAASSQVSIRFNIQGFNTTISTGYSSSIDALKYAIDFIRLGRVKAVLVGGVESLSLPNFIGFYNLGFFAGINGEEVSCPFDKRRNGIILSEGAAVVLIEDEEYARQRNANIYAEVNGVGNFFDAFRMGKYDPEASGLKNSIKEAIRSSGLGVDDIDYISASANSVPEQDRLETKVIKSVFGRYAYNIPVSAIKSMTGEPFSAAGLFQIAGAVGSMYNSFIPPTINFQERDKDCDLDYVANKSRIARIRNVLINNFGPGGSNAAFILSKWN